MLRLTFLLSSTLPPLYSPSSSPSNPKSSRNGVAEAAVGALPDKRSTLGMLSQIAYPEIFSWPSFESWLLLCFPNVNIVFKLWVTNHLVNHYHGVWWVLGWVLPFILAFGLESSWCHWTLHWTSPSLSCWKVSQSSIQIPALAQLYKWGLCCILKLGDSHGGFLKERQCLFSYIRGALSLLWKVTPNLQLFWVHESDLWLLPQA